ncbi:MAG: hypothetical protein COA54_07445 [Thiotrichaceae bacterium]|nr:MAG: hypothetical protein COA54_07445 [Thiotrichaceae bacterium]
MMRHAVIIGDRSTTLSGLLKKIKNVLPRRTRRTQKKRKKNIMLRFSASVARTEPSLTLFFFAFFASFAAKNCFSWKSVHGRFLTVIKGKKKRGSKIRVKNYHQREDGGNMKKTFNCLIEYKNIII